MVASDLCTALVKVSVSERGGAIAQTGFDYQTHWALSKIIHLENEDKNYAVILEFHDDIVVLNSADKPTKAEFYQVKSTRKAQWSIADLVRKSKNNTNSILSKLYRHRINFGEHVKSLNFVSNVICKEFLFSNKPSCFNCLEEKAKNRLVESIKTAFPYETDPKVDLFYYNLSDLSFSDLENHSFGKFANYISSKISEFDYKTVAATHRMVITEIRKRSRFEHDISEYRELIKLKSITREEFQKWISLLINTMTTKTNWNEINVDLSEIDYAQRRLIKKAINNLCLRRIDKTDKSVDSLFKVIKIYDFSQFRGGSLLAFLEWGYDEIRANHKDIINVYTREEILAALILGIEND